ncbi:MAG: transporter substrate-binding domain-containing protein, partial [Pseudomonadota bacterium]
QVSAISLYYKKSRDPREGLPWDQFAGQKIGVVKSTAHQEFGLRNLQDCQLVTRKSNKQLFSLLKDRKIDAVLCHRDELEILDSKSRESLRASRPVDYGIETCPAIARDNHKMAHQVGQALRTLHDQGLLHLLTRYHLDRNIETSLFTREMKEFSSTLS